MSLTFLSPKSSLVHAMSTNCSIVKGMPFIRVKRICDGTILEIESYEELAENEPYEFIAFLDQSGGGGHIFNEGKNIVFMMQEGKQIYV